MDLAKMLFNPYVASYLMIAVVTQWAYLQMRQRKAQRVAAARRAQSLPDTVMMDHADNLAEQRRDALNASAILMLTLVITPFILIALASYLAPETDATATQEQGLALVFATLMVWLLVSGTDIAKATLGGLALKTLAAFKLPFQLGDRVTLRGVSGKVVGFDSFFVKLQTVNDDLISIPTHSLWNEVLSSANAGQRCSLCVMNFYLSPKVDQTGRQGAEDAIWDAIQASSFFEPSQPLQIYLTQHPWAIRLTAKAYVASTYNEALFTSDVTQAFLDYAAKAKLALPTLAADKETVANTS
jgi:hypothetical protein